MSEPRTIPVGRKGLMALVDEADYPLVARYTWYTERRGVITYARRKWSEGGRERSQYLHNLILGIIGIDHQNQNGLDNRRANLRPANQSENGGNQRSRAGSSSFKGVHWFSRNSCWRAQIKVGRRARHLGYFGSEAAAARAYDKAARRAFGEYARLNFPDATEET